LWLGSKLPKIPSLGVIKELFCFIGNGVS